MSWMISQFFLLYSVAIQNASQFDYMNYEPRYIQAHMAFCLFGWFGLVWFGLVFYAFLNLFPFYFPCKTATKVAKHF